MNGHALRGMVSAWLGLIVLQTFATSGSGKVAGLMGDVNRLVKRALDPNVAAIPDRRNGAAPAPAPAAGVASPAIPPGFVGPVQPRPRSFPTQPTL